MSTSDVIAIVGVVIAGLGALSGLVVFALRSMVAPLRIVIENNTEALRAVMDELQDHACKLENHGERLVEIETVHKMEGKK